MVTCIGEVCVSRGFPKASVSKACVEQGKNILLCSQINTCREISPPPASSELQAVAHGMMMLSYLGKICHFKVTLTYEE